LIAKYRRRFPDFDAKVISLCARGLSMREIEGHLRDLCIHPAETALSARSGF